MEKVVIRQLYRHLENHEGKKVQLTGWVRSNRAQKAFGFIMVNDGTFFHSVQVVYEDQLENFKSIQKIRVGSAILVEGTVVATPNAKQPFEIKATNVELLGDSPEDYPIQPKRHTREFLRKSPIYDHGQIYLQQFSVFVSVRAYAIHKFFQERTSSMSIHQSLRLQMPKVQVKCSKLRHLTSNNSHWMKIKMWITPRTFWQTRKPNSIRSVRSRSIRPSFSVMFILLVQHSELKIRIHIVMWLNFGW